MKQLTQTHQIKLAIGVSLLLVISGIIDVIQLMIEPELYTSIKLAVTILIIGLELHAIKKLRGQNGKK